MVGGCDGQWLLVGEALWGVEWKKQSEDHKGLTLHRSDWLCKNVCS